MNRERLIGVVAGGLLVIGAVCLLGVAAIAGPWVAGLALAGALCWAAVATEVG